jgi:hypothetical protein
MKTKFFSSLLFLCLITMYTTTRADINCGGSSNGDNSRGAYSCTLTSSDNSTPLYGGDSYLVPANTEVYYVVHADCFNGGATQAQLAEPTEVNVVAPDYANGGQESTTVNSSAYNISEQWFDLWVSGDGGTSYVTISWAN